jgi:hypothetical protein
MLPAYCCRGCFSNGGCCDVTAAPVAASVAAIPADAHADVAAPPMTAISVAAAPPLFAAPVAAAPGTAVPSVTVTM